MSAKGAQNLFGWEGLKSDQSKEEIDKRFVDVAMVITAQRRVMESMRDQIVSMTELLHAIALRVKRLEETRKASLN